MRHLHGFGATGAWTFRRQQSATAADGSSVPGSIDEWSYATEAEARAAYVGGLASYTLWMTLRDPSGTIVETYGAVPATELSGSRIKLRTVAMILGALAVLGAVGVVMYKRRGR